MSKMDSTRVEELLNWLADEVAARLQARARPAVVALPAQPPPRTALEHPPAAGPKPGNAAVSPAATVWESGAPIADRQATGSATPESQVSAAPAEEPPHDGWQSLDAAADAAGASARASRFMGRLTIGLLVAVVLINIPLFAHGAALARIIPSSTSLIIRDGLMVKEADKPEVYVYQKGKFHWITDLGVFQHYGYRWENVYEVKPGFLADFELGRPVYLLAKCPDSPHIYRLENGVKRWIVDIPTFEAEGYLWSDVQFMDCYTLRDMPMGETIPPGRGPAPQP